MSGEGILAHGEYTHKLGHGLVPPEQGQAAVYDLVERLGNEFDLSSFACKPGVSTPHLTVFQGKYRSESDVSDRMSQLDITALPSELKVEGVSIWDGKIVFLDFECPSELQDFHNNTFETVFPLAEGKSADPQDFTDITDLQRQMFGETGYPFACDAYLPHITLAHLPARLTGDSLVSAEKRMNEILADSSVETVLAFERFVIYRVGEKGACLENFSFQAELTN